jgi:hypothetical protein
MEEAKRLISVMVCIWSRLMCSSAGLFKVIFQPSLRPRERGTSAYPVLAPSWTLLRPPFCLDFRDVPHQSSRHLGLLPQLLAELRIMNFGARPEHLPFPLSYPSRPRS